MWDTASAWELRAPPSDDDMQGEAMNLTSHALLVPMAMSLAAVTMLASPIAAHQWPTRPVTIVVPFASGGATDVLGRIIHDVGVKPE